MSKIDWDEYKHYKQQRQTIDELDNFELLLEFLRSFYNKSSSFEVFDILSSDEIGEMMLQKRDIKKPEQLEDYLYKRLSR